MDDKAILERFDKMRLNNEEYEEIRQALPQFIIYKAISKRRYDGYCTACKDFFDFDRSECRINYKVYQLPPTLHRRKGKCPKCGADVTFLAGGKLPVKTYYYRAPFAVFREINGNLYIRCVEIVQKFESGFNEWNGITEYDVDFRPYEWYRYYCGEDGAARWKPDYYDYPENSWIKLKSIEEPSFQTKLYTAIGLGSIEKSFLKYCGWEEFIEQCHSRGQDAPLIKYLCTIAKYPQLEKLMKCGFEGIVLNRLKVGYNIQTIRLNLRGTTPQKILRLNSNEMKMLSGCTARTYKNYLEFRKNIEVKGDFWSRFKRFDKFIDCLDLVERISEKTGLSHEKVMNYIERQNEGKNTIKDTAIDWRDYLEQCRTLGYDLTDSAISKPKNLAEGHIKLTKLIKDKQSEALNESLEQLMNERAKLEFESGEYIVIQPKSVGEIVVEGKMLSHCVGGYAERHAKGQTTIMFLREKSKPKIPFYTIEITKDLKIQQCRGYKNNNAYSQGGSPKPQEIKDFEVIYQEYLDKVFAAKGKKTKLHKTKKIA